MRLNGKTAIVTGAGSGFGEGIAAAFAREGAKVAVADINEAGGQRVAAAINAAGGQAVFVRADVSDNAAVANLLAATLKAFDGLDIVVNNAGTTHRNRPMLEVEEDEFDRIYAINVKSIYLTAKHMVPYFRAHGGGSFINIASTAAIRPRPGLTWYNGSKGAGVTTSKSMAAELGPDNIRVNCVNPVIGATGLLADFMGVPDTPENRKRFLATIPLGRFSTPQDIANACLYLASDETAFITGACLEVDGGRCV
ncbi:alcohol dehydrogenase [Bordetella pertussis]|uniref:SDR family oxidoreductase n=1 Tax=Bordetella pertussis TaxID=520 RepID=UPI00061C90E7|nr:SDR family oxidoreductase [Bordetella pertussis]CPM50609.1 alcohol dehydrogenase [Bordetella pertussis]